MAGLLISGPAGAGKSAVAREERRDHPRSVLLEFQEIYGALGGILRLPNGRFPERLPSDDYLLPLTEYTRRVAITAAQERELFTIVTNSDGQPERRRFLLSLLGPGAGERIIDPGREVVVDRLSIGGELSFQCGEAIDRWYGRLGG